MGARKRKQAWTVGDVFAIPPADGRHGVGQVIGREAAVLNSVTIALFDVAVSEPDEAAVGDLSMGRVFSLLFTTRDLLDSARWQVVASRAVAVPRDRFPYEHTRASGWIGARVIGAGIVEEFVNAYFGLTAWDAWKDPRYLDGLLLSPDKKPCRR